uniref:Sugar ABC transporter ATP-binding protein n=1 Tax=Bellilinea caldifistulae TaxID=360411 RepID=A0A7C4Q3Z9_9CHLR
MSAPILEMKQIVKEFPGVKALKNVSFTVMEGEVHCLVGENGAGKSTLMKVLSGVYPYGNYEGQIFLNGQEQKFSGVRDSEKAGIGIIYQELALVPELSVYENIFIGNEIQRNGIVDWNETIRRADEVMRRVGLNINPATKVKDLSVGKQQLVEIAKALSREVRLLILDEPTSALNEVESENLLNLIRDLKRVGVTSILISHKLKEVLDIADRITVLRDGETICTLNPRTEEVTERILIKHMVGRELDSVFPPAVSKPRDEVLLEVKNWTAYDPGLGRTILKDVSFYVRRGEIVGIAGLMGAGRTELALSLFGNPYGYQIQGEMIFKGKKQRFTHPHQAIREGLAYVTEDRKAKGLILIQDIRQNITIANLQALAKGGVIDANAEVALANRYHASLNIKAPSVEQIVGNLSGGNQQKVSIAKWLFVEPSLLILDDPTRGIDVGAKYEIHSIMRNLVAEGMSIIMISSELPEVLGMSDRVYVLSSGRITGELSAEEATQEKIMELATN